jgi:hypothetical protein
LIFTKEHAQAVLEGRKTQTRRLVKPGEILIALPGTGVWVEKEPAGDSVLVPPLRPSGRVRWRRGGIYAIQDGRGRPALGRFQLMAIRRERLQEITVGDAIREGSRESQTPLS